MDDIKAKQQIVEKIKASTNILVTVSNDPSVDALSAALGLTLLLDKLDKHPTAIFSGAVPPAISFLEPEKTFDTTTDSLRDFIIALDKEKADHIRLSKEGDVVRIFVTPYKTTITSDDLTFSQGDVTVELVIALGVTDQAHLDGALEAHGQILHDASIITVTAGDDVSTLGGIDWHDAQSSSLSEMISGLAEALKTDKTKPLLDKQIATALLTGIVAETDRFSNPHTTARVMTTAAQLMAGGADQQLIASKLEAMHEIGDLAVNDDSEKPEETPEEETSKDNLEISHQPNETLEEMDKRVKSAEQAQAAEVAGDALEAKTGEVVPETPTPTITDAYAPDTKEETAEPTLGGTLNATTEQAAEDNRNELENDQNKTILSHSYMASSPSYSAPMNGAAEAETPTPAVTEILGHDAPAAPGSTSVNDIPPTEGVSMNPAYAFDSTPTPASTAAPAPMTPPAPADLGLPMPPPLPDFSQSPSITPDPAYGVSPAAVPPERLGDILAPEPPAPTAPTPPPSTPSTPSDPGQFQIPTQP